MEENGCQLGYPIKQIYADQGKYLGMHLENQPLEECPKPKTTKEMIMEWEIQERERLE